MRNQRLLFLILLLGFIQITVSTLCAQDEWWQDKKYKSEKANQKYSSCKRIFKEIATGFSASSVSIISQHFSNEVYLDIISYEKGFYSSSQAEFMLSDFMDYFKIVSFKYSRSYHKNSYAFTNGKYVYNIGSGKRELNVSVSLKYRDDVWIVDQININ
jgi:hypothetical protein